MRALFSPNREDLVGCRSIFLAGPTARRRLGGQITPWRREALKLLDPHLLALVPEASPGSPWDWSLEEQIKWEEDHLEAASCIMFWIPREMGSMPGLTTNVEWGRWCDSGKVVLGYPPKAQHMGYIRHYAKKLGVPCAHTLRDTVDLAEDMVLGRRAANTIKVDVRGPAGSGKSTIAWIIHKELWQHGFRAEVEDANLPMGRHLLNACLKSLPERTLVRITTRNTRR